MDEKDLILNFKPHGKNRTQFAREWHRYDPDYVSLFTCSIKTPTEFLRQVINNYEQRIYRNVSNKIVLIVKVKKLTKLGKKIN